MMGLEDSLAKQQAVKGTLAVRQTVKVTQRRRLTRSEVSIILDRGVPRNDWESAGCTNTAATGMHQTYPFIPSAPLHA